MRRSAGPILTSCFPSFTEFTKTVGATIVRYLTEAKRLDDNASVGSFRAL